jgi:ABC-type siderophore export system fused ATPase/permease subunit
VGESAEAHFNATRFQRRSRFVDRGDQFTSLLLFKRTVVVHYLSHAPTWSTTHAQVTMVLMALFFVPCVVVVITTGLPILLFLITVAATAIFWYQSVLYAVSDLREAMQSTATRTVAPKDISFEGPALSTKLQAPTTVKMANWTTPSRAVVAPSCASHRDHGFEFTPRRRVRFA